MIDWDKIKTAKDKTWLISMTQMGVPAEVRAAAVRLYELGDKDLAIEMLLRQFRQYKDPNVHPNIKGETCITTMLTIGQLGDKRVIDDIIEAFDEFSAHAAFAASLLGGEDLQERLLDLSKDKGIKGFSAIIALGFMKNKEVLPTIIGMLSTWQEYNERFEGKVVYPLRSYIMYILSNYDNVTAEQLFVDNLTKPDIDRYASDYSFVERRLAHGGYKYVDLSTFGWRISKKYGWDKHLDTDGKRFAFESVSILHWKNYYKTLCPFESDAEVEKLRDGIVEKIWKEIKDEE